MNGRLQERKHKITGLIICFFFLMVAMLLSLRFGTTGSSWSIVFHTYMQPDDSTAQTIIRTTRMPRTLIAVCVGGSLGIAGALVQAVTRNPLASPTIFGINAGAALAVVIAITFFYVQSFNTLIWFAFVGAGISTAIVYGLGSVGHYGLTPLKITLAGAAIAALFSSLTSGILVINEQSLEAVLFWLAGSVADGSLTMLAKILPIFGLAWLLALLMARPITTLMIGDDVAKGLGQRTQWVKGLAGLLVAVLAGGAVAIAGPIMLVGLMIPHLARFFVGTDHRWAIPYCFFLGAIFLLIADTAARLLARPEEIPVGALTAAIGAVFFVFIARKQEGELS